MEIKVSRNGKNIVVTGLAAYLPVQIEILLKDGAEVSYVLDEEDMRKPNVWRKRFLSRICEVKVMGSPHYQELAVWERF